MALFFFFFYSYSFFLFFFFFTIRVSPVGFAIATLIYTHSAFLDEIFVIR